jgi:hypothetical protein
VGRWPTRRRVLVNLQDGKAFSGVLWAKRGPLLVLRGAELLEPGCDPAPLDGDVLIERPQISFIQTSGG